MQNIGLILQIIIILISSLILGKLNLIKIENKDLYTTVIPLLAVVFSTVLIRSKYFISFCSKLKYFISNEPIKWEVRGLFSISEDSNKMLESIYEHITKKLSKEYKSIKCDYKDNQRILLNIDCVRVELINSLDISNRNQTIDITFSSESPIKTFNRKHLEKMINPTFNYLGKLFNSIKFEATANKQYIPMDKLSEFDSTLEVINYCIDLKTRNKKSNLSLSKDFGFVCVANSWKECLHYINKYILV